LKSKVLFRIIITNLKIFQFILDIIKLFLADCALWPQNILSLDVDLVFFFFDEDAIFFFDCFQPKVFDLSIGILQFFIQFFNCLFLEARILHKFTVFFLVALDDHIQLRHFFLK